MYCFAKKGQVQPKLHLPFSLLLCYWSSPLRMNQRVAVLA